VKIYVGLYRVIGLELSQGRKWRETEVCTLHRTSCCTWFAYRIGEVKLWATAVTADIRNFLQVFRTNSNRCFRLRIKPSLFPLSNSMTAQVVIPVFGRQPVRI